MAKGVTIDLKTHHGVPVVSGTRIPVARILGSLASGMRQEELMQEYALSEQQIRDAMRYAAQILESEKAYPISN
jgi:uncharacterized protein (DUF433 family)